VITDEICDVFDHPRRMWAQVYASLSPAAQLVMVALALAGPVIPLSELEEAVSISHSEVIGQLESSLRELDDTFIKITRSGRYGDTVYVDFLNPSIQDFIESVLEGTPELVRSFIAEAPSISQPSTVVRMAEAQSHTVGPDFPRMRTWVARNASMIIDSMITIAMKDLTTHGSDAGHIVSIVDFADKHFPSVRLPKLQDLLDRIFAHPNQHGSIPVYFSLLMENRRQAVVRRHLKYDFFESALQWAVSAAASPGNFEAVVAMQQTKGGTGADWDAIYTAFRLAITSRVASLGEDDDDDIWTLQRELDEYGRLADELGVDIDELKDAFEAYISEIPPEDDDYEESGSVGSTYASRNAEKELNEMDAMFLQLTESRTVY
jgi:hypothetical protein